MAAKKPNILILWGDDIGYWNISAYNLGQMGYRTPNIDRIAKEGALFTDWYGQQSCTAGRACFITGQSGFRTGMLKVGLPGAKEGLQARDVTIAELLKDQGYMTAQFGKNHLGDADETLPTAHGFDEFFGSLYHLNAEEEFENEDYFKDPALIEKYKTRGVLHCWANPDGTPEDRKQGSARQEADGDHRRRSHGGHARLSREGEEGRQAVLPVVELHAHAHQHAPEEGERGQDRARHLSRWHGRTRRPRRADPRQAQGARPRRQHHRHVLDRQRRRVLHLARWRHDALPRREERELGGRLSRALPMRWPGVIEPGTINNDLFSHEDMLPTLLAAVGVPDVKEQLLTGMKVGKKTFKVHLDGYNITDRLAGKGPNPRNEFFYWNDDGSLVGLRYGNWKVVFQEQRSEGFDVWQDPFTALRLPKIINLRSDPFERAEEIAMNYGQWRIDRTYLLVPAQEYVAKYIATFKDFPPSQKVGSFSLDQVLEKLTAASTSGR